MFEKLSPKAKRLLMFTLGIGFIFLVVSIFSPENENSRHEKEKTVKHVLTDFNTRELGVDSIAANLKLMYSKNKELEDELSRVRKELEVIKKNSTLLNSPENPKLKAKISEMENLINEYKIIKGMLPKFLKKEQLRELDRVNNKAQENNQNLNSNSNENFKGNFGIRDEIENGSQNRIPNDNETPIFNSKGELNIEHYSLLDGNSNGEDGNGNNNAQGNFYGEEDEALNSSQKIFPKIRSISSRGEVGSINSLKSLSDETSNLMAINDKNFQNQNGSDSETNGNTLGGSLGLGLGNLSGNSNRGNVPDRGSILSSDRNIGKGDLSQNKSGTSTKILSDKTLGKRWGKNNNSDAKFGKRDAYIPSGTLISGRLITGLDAPTKENAKEEPFPVLINIDKEALLPNDLSYDFSGCFVIAAGFGDMSSERVYLRTETLSCVLKNGQTIETKINGFVAGEDGKAGMRGRLVSKQGKLIARSLLAGFLEGLAGAFDVNPVPVINTSSSENVDYQKVYSKSALQGAAVSGSSKALERLANFYLKLAQDMFPVLEIDADRKVDIIITQGFSVKTE